MKLIILLFVCLLACAEVSNETTENFEITETSSLEPDFTTISASYGRPNCTCVPYYVCENEKAEIQEGLCEEYLQECCVVSAEKLPSLVSNPNKKKRACGKRNRKGNPSEPKSNETLAGEFPWMVALLNIEQNGSSEVETIHCGASLIHPQVVLTAAHCVHNKNSTYKIRAGEWDIRSKIEIFPHQDRQIKETIIHPKYHNGALFYDFALLILESPLEITDNVDVVCLPNENVILRNNLFCYATGWGKDAFTAQDSTILKKIGLPLIDRDTCQNRLRETRLGSYFKLHESFICAGGEVGKDTCKGDGGGPLVCPIHDEEDMFYQAGVVSWGIDCGKSVPGVYANIVKVVGWIDNTMMSHKLDAYDYRY